VDVNGQRSITEVYELANDSSVTKVASGSPDGAAWSALLPSGASQFQVTQGDVPAAAVKFENGRALVLAPIAPGLKQLALTYSMPASRFPMSVLVNHDTQIFEALIEEKTGKVTGPKLKEVAPVALEKRSFRRFLGADVPASSVAVFDLPSAGKRTDIEPRYMVMLTVLFGGTMVFALARALKRR
jgi:hypothetical protein